MIQNSTSIITPFLVHRNCYRQKCQTELQSWTKLLRQNRKFHTKLMLLAKFQAFYNKTWPQSTLTWGGKGLGEFGIYWIFKFCLNKFCPGLQFDLTVHYFYARVQTPTCTNYDEDLRKRIMTVLTPKSHKHSILVT